MASYYTYFISSLPTLHFSGPLPFSYQKFLQLCNDIISEGDLKILRNISLSEKQEAQPTLNKWHAFDIILRNELVKVRASRKNLDPIKYLREDGYISAEINHIVMNAFRNPSLIESESILDEFRWRFLDQLVFGHYFDIDFLVVYAIKLLILERWDKIRKAEKEKLLEETLQTS